MSRFFSSQNSVDEILVSLNRKGFFIFPESKTMFGKLYDKLESIILQQNILQGCAAHPRKGNLYFIYDAEKYLYSEAVEMVTKQ